MPRQNRVTPFGDIVAVPGRGMFMGNRGILHDGAGRIVRHAQGRRWIACRTEFRGRRRSLMRPGSYTELFFLDEAVALAAGHRPCAECRHEDYERFRAAWEVWHSAGPPTAASIDIVLQRDRLIAPGVERTYRESGSALPDGAYIAVEGVAWLVWQDELLAWSADGYVVRRARDATGQVDVVTPRSIVRTLAAGYRPVVHPSAAR